MKLNKLFLSVLVSMVVNVSVFAKEEIVINFKNLEIENFIKITSKILHKNILLSSNIKGKVEFVTNKKIYKEDILNILIYVLESKGYTIVENGNILRVIRLSDASKYNVPVYNNKKQLTDFQMVTEVFNIDFLNVDYISSKIRHLISKSAKLVTDKESNAIILTDFASNIQTIKKVIEMVAQDSQKDIQIVSLKNIQGSAVFADMKLLAKSIFNEKIEKEKVAILFNKNNNSMMFVGKKENVDFLVKYLEDMDKAGSLVEKTVSVIGLKNAESKNVIKIINGIIAQKVYKDKADKPFASSDEESNSIILMGPKDELDYFSELVDKLDVDKQQVYVKARIIEISETGTSNMGIQYGLEGLASGGDGALTFAGNLGGSSVALSSTVSSYIDIPDVTNGLILGASINLLKENYALDVVSEPSLLCINNKESSIYVGETRSISTGTTSSTDGDSSSTYTREDIGLTLKVKPRISNGNKVTLEITATMEDVSETDVSTQPNTNKKEVVTTAIVTNGESVILGGLSKNKKESTENKVPFFGDLPLIGGLFRNNSELNDKINLVIIITPYIIPKSEDLTYVRDKLAELKLLEDKYTKDTKLRLEKLKLRGKVDDLHREEERLGLSIERENVREDMIVFSEDKKEHEDEKKKYDSQVKSKNQLLHEKRIKEMFGL